MKLKKEEIEHIAELSRLELSEEEKGRYQGELSSILDYIEMLKEVDTKGVEITASVSGLRDVLREDKIKEWDKDEVDLAFLQSEKENGSVKVKKVL